MRLARILIFFVYMLTNCAYESVQQAEITYHAQGTQEQTNLSEHSPPRRLKDLPTWRKAVGVTSMMVGAAAISIGIANMIDAFILSRNGCNVFGLDGPCALNRYGFGVPMVAGGAVLAGLGGLSLGLKY